MAGQVRGQRGLASNGMQVVRDVVEADCLGAYEGRRRCFFADSRVAFATSDAQLAIVCDLPVPGGP